MLFVILILLFIDLLSYKALYSILKNKSKGLRLLFIALHWSVPIVLLIASLITIKSGNELQNASVVYRSFLLGGLFLLFYIPKLVLIVFHITDDIYSLTVWIIRFISSRLKAPPETTAKTGSVQHKPVSRRFFITKTGLALASVPFISIIYGTTRGRFNFRIERLKLNMAELPGMFDAIRIVHISDFHIAGFYNNEDQLNRAVEIINSLDADLILFTGDFVNVYASEILAFKDILIRLRAKTGTYSILGNHDYGDYHSWPDEKSKKENFSKIIQYQEDMGFKMLRNESTLIERAGQQIAIAGVENWGKPPFAQYGDLKRALGSIPEGTFTILLSHDPSHWDAEVLDKGNIPLTLSGHTHGMQFGFERADIKWSPVQYKYPRWGGLYREKDQYLYVNRGMGCIGYPGRVGMPPEITLIELMKA